MHHHKSKNPSKMSGRRNGKDSITVEIMPHCLLRWLGGGSFLDIWLSAGTSKAAFYSCIYKYIDAILDSVALAFKFPNTAKESHMLKSALWPCDLLLYA